MAENDRARERRRTLRHLARVARLAVRLRRAPAPSGRGGRPPDRPLRAVFLPIAPANDAGMAFRVYGWKPHLERRGFEVRILPPSTEAEFADFVRGSPGADVAFLEASLRSLPSRLREAEEADVVVLHRSLLPFSPWQRPTLERLLARRNPRLVFDFFDSLWARRRAAHAASRSPPARWLNPPDRIEAIVRAAAAVTVPNEFLASFARPLAREVQVLPMVIDAARYPLRCHEARERIVIGWMGNAGNLSRLEAVLPALRRVAARRRIVLRVTSSAPFRADGLEVESLVHPWSHEAEIRELAGIDVGICPMEDTEIDRGKSPLKLLQFGGSAIPVVASPVALDRETFVHDRNILLAETEEEWADAVERLAADAAARARLGAALRSLVAARFTYEACAGAYAALLRSVGSTPS